MKSQNIKAKSWVISMALAMFSMFSSTAANAADGCKFLLCIAGPWSSISQCVPTVHAVFHDLARGRPFPTCSMAGAGNSANNTWVGESSCPSMYRRYGENGYEGCSYPGLISVSVNGAPWSQVFWNTGGSTSTLYSNTATTAMTQQTGSAPIDDHFVTDLNRWNTQVTQCQGSGGTVEFDSFGAFQRCYLPESNGGG